MPVTHSPDGVEISYSAAGEGPPHILFMHGWAGSGSYFEEMLHHLDLERLRAITIDLRGHGDSGSGDDSFTLDGVAADTLAIADADGAERFVLVGFSMSAKFAQYIACVAPQRVLGQILVAGCPSTEIPLPPELLDDRFGRAGDARRMIEIATIYSAEPIEHAVLERFGEQAARVSAAMLEASLRACIDTSFADRLGTERTSTLVVGGTQDQIFTPDVLRDAVAAPLGGTLELLDCGHEIPLERPRDLATLVQAFVTEFT